jgi:hypothetical protein
MGQRQQTILIGLVTLAIVGCASEQATVPPAAPSPEATASPVPAPNAAGSQAFAKPLVAQSPAAAVPAIPGLIQPTNPQERRSQVGAKTGSSRTDAFAGLPPAPVRAAANNPQQQAGMGGTVASAAAAQGQGRGVPSGSPLLPKPEVPPKVSVAAPGQGITATGNSAPRPAIVLPPKPSTELAKGVEVTGVVLVRNIPHAIVKAPNEETSRYVRVGERLSNGKVLVKRIEMNMGSEPVVVLEENGVEVARMVGDKPVAQVGSPSA